MDTFASDFVPMPAVRTDKPSFTKVGRANDIMTGNTTCIHPTVRGVY